MFGTPIGGNQIQLMPSGMRWMYGTTFSCPFIIFQVPAFPTPLSVRLDCTALKVLQNPRPVQLATTQTGPHSTNARFAQEGKENLVFSLPPLLFLRKPASSTSHLFKKKLTGPRLELSTSCLAHQFTLIFLL